MKRRPRGHSRHCINITPFIAFITHIVRHTPPHTATWASAPKSYIVRMMLHYVTWFSRLFSSLKRRVRVVRDDAITTHDNQRNTHARSRANRGGDARDIYIYIYLIVSHREARGAAVDDASRGVPTLGILNHPGARRVGFASAPRATDARISRGLRADTRGGVFRARVCVVRRATRARRGARLINPVASRSTTTVKARVEGADWEGGILTNYNRSRQYRWR